jgi:hypothetical protein
MTIAAFIIALGILVFLINVWWSRRMVRWRLEISGIALLFCVIFGIFEHLNYLFASWFLKNIGIILHSKYEFRKDFQVSPRV